MAAPFPPAGNQQMHTERPLKIYAEQYLAAAPLPIGVVVVPDIYVDGFPRVYTPTRTYVVHDTDWVISNRYTGDAIEVISAEEFAERFGPSA